MKVIFGESLFSKKVPDYFLRFFFLLNKWIKVFSIDVSLEQDIFITTIIISNKAEVLITETKFIF